jgi:hemerythrin
MELIIWKDEYSVGVPEFDEQHMGLIDLINRLAQEGQKAGMVETVLDALDRYVKEHFRAEEALMRAHKYEGLEEHRMQHEVFEEWLNAVKLTYGFTASTDVFAETVNAFLRNWLINHILKTDMDYKGVLSKRS